jgi:hypothetical protein
VLCEPRARLFFARPSTLKLHQNDANSPLPPPRSRPAPIPFIFTQAAALGARLLPRGCGRGGAAADCRVLMCVCVGGGMFARGWGGEGCQKRRQKIVSSTPLLTCPPLQTL